MTTEALAFDFAKLFTGRTDAYGLGKGGVERLVGAPTVPTGTLMYEYAAHLAGSDTGLGIFPLLDDGTVRFAAIDLDEPDFELAMTLTRFYPAGAPAWIERSRSGNAHVWAFFAGPTPAWAVRVVLRGALESVGRTDVEVFPKQDQLREGMLGNYINLPYHGHERPIVWKTGDPPENVGRAAYTAPGFTQRALAERHAPKAWLRRAETMGGVPPEEREASTEFGQQPVLHECATYILERKDENPLVPGHRAVVLFNVAVMLLNYRDMTEREARELVHELNAAGTHPAPDSEVDRQFDNALNRRFTRTGCDDPVMAGYVRPDCPIARGETGR